jgi:MFS transporter, FSR family, fosmidomycin resistance protein
VIRSATETGQGSLKGDVRIMTLVGGAHFISHFFQLTLPPLFPLLRDVFAVSYTELGLLMGLFYAASGIGQTGSGFLVDHFGARRVLPCGMALLAGAMGVAGMAPAYWALALAAVLGGLGNSVFHPADYSIFNASVSPPRLGRAYSIHGICGNLGWAVAPAVVVGLAAPLGWRGSLLTVAVFGIAAAFSLSTQSATLADRVEPVHRGAATSPGLRGSIGLLFAPSILTAFVFFALIATSLIGIQTFSVAAMVKLFDAPLGLATGALTAFLLGSAVGILIGGFLADRTTRHDLVAGCGLILVSCL